MARLNLDPEHVWNLYQEQKSTLRVAKILGISSFSVGKCLHDNGHILKTNPPLTLEALQKIADGRGGKVLSDKFLGWNYKIKLQCAEGHIWETQPGHIKNGTWCKICSLEEFRTYNVDHDFFARDTEESFYWAGFIAADGNVRIRNQNNKKEYGHILTIDLSIKDLKHLEKFKEQVYTESPIKKYWYKKRHVCNNKNPTQSKECCRLEINSKKIVLDLDRFGIIPAKTYHTYVPIWVKQHKYYRHFIRGFVDGDGCFTPALIKQSNTTSIRFTIKGTAIILNDFKDEFEKQGILTRDRKPITPKRGKKEPTFDTLNFGSNFIISKLYDYLYTDATVFLERKEKIAAKSKEWVDDTRQFRLYNVHTSGENLIELAKEHKSINKIANILQCSSGYVRDLAAKYKIHDQFFELVKKPPMVDPAELMKNIGKYNSVNAAAIYYNVSYTVIKNCLKKYNLREEFLAKITTRIPPTSEEILKAAQKCMYFKQLAINFGYAQGNLTNRIIKYGIKEQVRSILDNNKKTAGFQ